MPSLAVTGRADLTDAQWAALQSLLPTSAKPGRPPKWTKRQLIDGIRRRVRVGAPWRDVPPAYGPWQTVYGQVPALASATAPGNSSSPASSPVLTPLG